MSDYLLSTSDNPFNPHTNFDSWYAYDVAVGYNTCGYLDRIANTSMDLTDGENEAELNRAIDEIVNLNINGLYVKIPSPSLPDNP